VSAVASRPGWSGSRPAGTAELNLSPELELLLLCARRQMSGEHAEYALELLNQDLNWRLLLEKARAHRLTPLLYWHCRQSLNFCFPADVAAQFESQFRANVARSLLLVQDLFRAEELLRQNGIPAVPFKGPALAESLYGSAALRESVDLDILIRRRDLPEALRSLVAAGYRDGKQLTAAQQRAYIDTQYEYPLLSPSGTLLELQWRIVPRYFSLSLVEDQYWSRVQLLNVDGREMNALSREDLLLFLCIHGGKHRWEKLIWLADVAELVASTPRLDWDRLLTEAQSAGAVRMLLLGLTLAHKLLAMEIPWKLMGVLGHDAAVEQMAGVLARDVVSDRLPTYVESQRYLVRVRERWQDRLRYLFRFTFTATPMEWVMADLPSSLSFLYRPLRVLRGAGKAVALARNSTSKLTNST